MESLKLRNLLSLVIIILGFAFIITIIVISYGKMMTFNEVKELSNIFLPVIATWVGTVIAFYFGKENFESANERVKEMVNKINPIEQLKKVLIKDVMITFDKITKFELPEGKDYKTVKLIELLTICKNSGITRIPIIQSNKVLVTVIHRSIIDLLISKYSLNPVQNEDIKEFTIQKLIDDNETKVFIKTQLCIKEDATLYDAKSAYDNEPNAQDVFITKSGSITEPVLGWVTENEIIKYLKA